MLLLQNETPVVVTDAYAMKSVNNNCNICNRPSRKS